ncbi:N-acetylmuramoyl-L-alanine amidase [Fontibacillus solani]|uniref:N-acetylmuramoyl-L-alanine amidase n=1 Tax=Fontibacillus solani TaxID=1572857 RepID=A0A7W3SSD3_9BACL|nr:N-acetylmuramoyl-L-alanine amidase family protein [Fontibacillus solani]MBA9085282.1 N-acetylmuramoyl-L-alanine amidase [Fontibacillus solani]
MKKIGSFILFMFFLLAFPVMGSAAPSTTHIYLDSVELQQPDNAAADIVKGNVMVPLRVIAEGLGYDVKWEQKTGTVTISQNKTSLKLVVNSDQAVVDSSKISLSTAPFLQNNTTMVPLRFVGEQMGLKVSWDNADKSAYLYSPNGGTDGEIINGGTSSSPGSATEVITVVNQPEQSESITPNTNNSPNGTGTNVNLAQIEGMSYSDNRLVISATGNIEPQVFTLTAPSRIVVDIPQAAFSDNFRNTLSLDDQFKGEFSITDDTKISGIRYSLFSNSPSTIRVVMVLNQDSLYSVTNSGEGQVFIDLEEKRDTGRKLVVIDAGHGGSQPGAIGVTKKQEKDFTLGVALKVETILKQDPSIDFVLTRTTDVTMSLQDRVKVANDLAADLFVSIHGNSLDTIKTGNNPSGSETYYSRDESIPFANVMHKHLVAATGLNDRKVRYSSLHVTRETVMPAVLLEAGYLSNTGDETLMYTEEFQQRVAEGIVAGIKEYLGL